MSFVSVTHNASTNQCVADSVIVLGTSIALVLIQLVLYEEFRGIGKHDTEVKTFNEHLNPEFQMEYGWLEEV